MPDFALYCPRPPVTVKPIGKAGVTSTNQFGLGGSGGVTGPGQVIPIAFAVVDPIGAFFGSNAVSNKISGTFSAKDDGG